MPQNHCRLWETFGEFTQSNYPRSTMVVSAFYQFFTSEVTALDVGHVGYSLSPGISLPRLGLSTLPGSVRLLRANACKVVVPPYHGALGSDPPSLVLFVGSQQKAPLIPVVWAKSSWHSNSCVPGHLTWCQVLTLWGLITLTLAPSTPQSGALSGSTNLPTPPCFGRSS